MATRIEWTEKTWNPTSGCSKLSEACDNCYAQVMARRLQGNHIKGYENGFKPTLHPERLTEPYSWKKPTMCFVVSMGDLFHKDIHFDYIDEVMDVIRKNPQHTFQILTKRAERMAEYFLKHYPTVPENAWLGVTCENGRYYYRVECLRQIKDAKVRFLSCEPLLGNMADIDLTNIDWVITGGESGVRARQTPIGWFRTLRDRCIETKTPFFFKQWGAYGVDGVKRSKYQNGRLLDGEVWNMMPGDKFKTTKK